jgi:MoaA/NifB/PqqE/SkfB family radical SAM enzyme
MAVLLRDNIDQLDEVIRMAARRDAYFMIQPYGRVKTGSVAHVHDDGPVAPKLLALRQKHANFLSNPVYLSQFDEYLAGGIPNCRAGRAFFNIDAAGDVAICVEHKHEPVGNLYRDPPGVLHQRLRRRSKGNRCTACWYNCRGEVESLYRPRSLLASLPTYIRNQGRPSQKVASAIARGEQPAR